MITKLVYILLLALLVAPAIAMPAAARAAINSNVWNPTILKGPLVTCWGAPVTYTNDAGGTGFTTSINPIACQSLCDLVATAANVVYFGIGVVIWIVAPIFIVWAGILLMLSRGSPEKVSEARKMITGVVIGLLIVICAYVIVYTFVSVVGISGVGGFGTSACSVLPGPAQAPPPPPGRLPTTLNCIPTTGNFGTCKNCFNSPGITAAAQCIGINPSFTYQGEHTCKPGVTSCHFGGACGDGAHAMDFSRSALPPGMTLGQLLTKAQGCNGAGGNQIVCQCELGASAATPCNVADHVHCNVNAASCSCPL